MTFGCLRPLVVEVLLYMPEANQICHLPPELLGLIFRKVVFPADPLRSSLNYHSLTSRNGGMSPLTTLFYGPAFPEKIQTIPNWFISWKCGWIEQDCFRSLLVCWYSKSNPSQSHTTTVCPQVQGRNIGLDLLVSRSYRYGGFEPAVPLSLDGNHRIQRQTQRKVRLPLQPHF